MFNPADHGSLLEKLTIRAARADAELELAHSPDRSLWGKMHDALVKSDTEEEHEAAHAALDDCLRVILAHAPGWVEEQVSERIQASYSPESIELLRSRPALEQARRRWKEVLELRLLCKTAVEEVKDAIAQCDSASTGALLDAMSAVRSSDSQAQDENAEASYAMNKARGALQRLGKQMERIHAAGVEEETPEWGDEMSDDLDAPGFAGAAIAALDHSKETFQEVLARVQGIYRQLAKLTDKEHGVFLRLEQAYTSREKPFRNAVLDQLPPIVRQLLHDRGLAQAPSEEVDHRPVRLDLAAIGVARE